MARVRVAADRAEEPAGYGQLLQDLKSRITGAQVRAALAANRELILLYWDIGRAIVERQEQYEWGASVIERLSRDLRASFPDSRGFSPRNLWRMRVFYLAYTREEAPPQSVMGERSETTPLIQSVFLPQAVAEMIGMPPRTALPAGQSVFLPRPVAEISEVNSQPPLPLGQSVILPQRVAEISGVSSPSLLPIDQRVIPPPAVAERAEPMPHFLKASGQSVILPQPVAEIGEAAPHSLPETGQSVILPHAVAEINEVIPSTLPASVQGVLPEPLADLPWGHNGVLLEKLSGNEERLWYARMSVRHGWSRHVLIHQIETGLYGRTGQAVTNFDRTLPAGDSDLVRELLKDPYHFEFLRVGATVQERDLERALLSNVRDFLMELGVGFALMGSQYHLEVGGQDFYLDLLFYHTKLRRHVVVELKIGAFQPEDIGKMHFYLSAVDDLVRHPGDGPSIGLILCKERNRVVAEYALRGAAKPIGIAEFRLMESLPEPLQGSLPSVREIEQRLQGEAVYGA